MHSTDTDVSDLPRGVYKARYRVNGRAVFVVVKADGERLKSVIAPPGASEEHLLEWLWQQLDRVDPIRPTLRLVRPAPKARALTLEELDRLYRDANPVNALLWRRKKERAAREGRRII